VHAEALALSEQVGDRRLACVALTNLGLVALARKDYSAARSCYARALEMAEMVGERRSIAESLEELAGVDAATGLMERAAVLFGASQGCARPSARRSSGLTLHGSRRRWPRSGWRWARTRSPRPSGAAGRCPRRRRWRSPAARYPTHLCFLPLWRYE
jgi:hypothetical protein